MSYQKKICIFEFTLTEINLLKTLTKGDSYWTRYPVPIRFENSTEEKILNGTKKIFLLIYLREWN
ncbi:hypothetical protein PI23P_10847 [Polaribacter irgensii 23-P]|uniref:Uncharacterized protein n=1 Tax=Polaribacter irgensii 23-P TaxID=313594 RepID=A4C122_9FLAO|nr:hypothetical protein PI23P_10847 [Polaribacter irgensii 23-P]